MSSGRSGESRSWKPEDADVPAHGAERVGVEPAAGGEHVGPGGADRARRDARRPTPPRRRRRRTARCRRGWPSWAGRPGRSGSTARRRPARRRRRGRRAGSRAGARCPRRLPTQPRPKSGTRLTSGRRPRRPAMRASSDGTATPVTVVVKMVSRSAGCRPASSSAPDNASQARSTACSMKRSLASPKSIERGVAVERQDEMAGVDLGVVVQAANDFLDARRSPGSATNASVISSWV